MRQVISLGVCLFSAAGCSQSSEPVDSPAAFTSADESAIRALIGEWDTAWAANDHARVLTLLTEDYVEAVANAVVGKEAALQSYQGFTQRYTATTSTVRRLEGRGDLAYAWTEFNARYTREDGERRLQSGNVLWVLKKDQDGQWRFAASAFQAASQADSTAAGQ